MFGLRRSFKTSIERRMALLFAGFCMVPLLALTGLAVSVIEEQTVDLTRQHLAQQSKSFAMHLIDRLDVAAWELSRAAASPREAGPSGSAAGSATWRWIRPKGSVPLEGAAGRTALRDVGNGFEISRAIGGRLYTGVVSDDVLFGDLDQTPFGITSCVKVGGRMRRCSGDSGSDRVIRAGWTLPLRSMYDTGVQIQVESSQPRRVVLGRIGVLYRVLPYLVFAIMTAGGWWVLLQIRARLAPIAELRRATEHIREGDYSTSVDVRSDDEFQGLGEAFNAMTRRLHDSFTSMQTLSEMDRMVLGGVALEDLARQALTLMKDLGLASGLVWLWDREAGGSGSEVYFLGDEHRVESRPLPLWGAAPAGEHAALTFLREHWSPNEAVCSAVRRDGDLCGLIACSEGPAAQRVLAELGDRISVAVTLYGRARELFRQAHYDGLTGLLNREAFNERLDHLCRGAGRESVRGAVICLDLDRFKQLNDTEGHQVGDRLLRAIGERLQGAMRSTDEVARLGGDEFAVLVPRIGQPAEIETLCRRLITEVGRQVEIDGALHVVEASLGVAVFPDDGSDGPTLLRKADVAMYKSKEHSGCWFTFFDVEMNREMEERARIEARLRHALEARELGLEFQPKIRVCDGTVTSVEGLLRWPAVPGMGPGQFIPVAEQTGLIHDLTKLLVEDARQCLERCRGAGFDLDRIAINISPRQFQRRGFAERFLALLHVQGLSPSDVEIEVTESVVVRDPAAVAADLELLRTAGVTVALDDFGTGYSSLNALRQLPLDAIKIDRSFVAPASESDQASDLVGRIIGIAHALDLVCVAEGVESERELGILTDRGCDAVQGFLFCPALPIDGLLEFLEAHSRDRQRWPRRGAGHAASAL